MVARRAVLAAFGLGPLAAVADGVGVGYGNTATCPEPEPFEGFEAADGEGPFEEVSEHGRLVQEARNYLDRQEQIDSRVNACFGGEPSGIADKRSWSTAFKRHVYRQDLRQQDRPNIWGMNFDDLMKLAAKRGWEI